MSRSPLIAGALAALALTLARPAHAAGPPDPDLALVPDAVLAEPSPPRAGSGPEGSTQPTAEVGATLEHVTTGVVPRVGLAVPVPGLTARWQDRTSLGMSLRLGLSPTVAVVVSDRMSVVADEGRALLSDQTVRNDLREVYVTAELSPRTFLEAGRINAPQGVGLGFRPTDYLREGSAIGVTSLDPASARSNRLGTLMLRSQTFFGAGSASLAFAPAIPPLETIADEAPLGVDPRFPDTNARMRVLASFGYEVLDFSPQIVASFQEGRTLVGASVTRQIGDSVVAWAEWAGGPSQPLLPRGQSDLSTGATWANASLKLSLSAEFHLRSTGRTRADWARWFDEGAARPERAPALWSERARDRDAQVPAAQHELFLRFDLPGPVRDSRFSGFALVNLEDGSTTGQLTTTFDVSDRLRLGLYVTTHLGAPRSERGSLPQLLVGSLEATFHL